MKRFLLKSLLFCFGIFLMNIQSNAQCSFNNFNSGNLTPTGIGAGGTATATGGGGDGYEVTVCAGAQYTATTCANSAFDTYLTVFNSAGVAIGWNDDACGQQSTVTWTSTYTGTAWVFLDRWVSNGNNCDHSGTGQQISVTQNTACVTTAPSNCGSYTAGVCGSSFTNHTTIGAGNDVATSSCHLDGGGTPIAMPGGDHVYGITIPAGQTTIVVNMNGVVDGNDTYAELLFLGYACSNTVCSGSIQYDIANGTFSNGTNTATFNVAPTGGVVYFIVDAQSTDGIYEYDISFNCFSSGIAFDSDGCGTDAADGDMNGLRPNINGSNVALTVNGCETYRLCERLYIENDNDWEWIDHVQFNLGSCYTNIANVSQPAGTYNGGTWAQTTGAGTIDWEFNPSGGNLLYGDGNAGNYQCQVQTFCFDFTVSAGCTNGIDLVIGIIVTDDGIGGAGATVVGTDVEVEDNIVLGNIPPQANAGPDDATCYSTPYTLAGSFSGLASSGTWSTSGTGTFSNATSMTSTYTASAADAVAGFVTITLTTNDPAGSCVPATDQMILTIDPPAVISAGSDVTVCNTNPINLNGTSSGATVTTTWSTSGSGTFSDATSLTSTYTPSAADDIAGTVTLTLTSSDPAGLCGPSSDQMVITFDNTAPVITCPGNISVNTAAGVCTASVTPANPTVTDFCSTTLTWATTGATVLSGNGNMGTQTFNRGTTTVTYTVVDSQGNTSTCSFTVTVTDNQNPTITSVCPTNQTVAANASCQYVLPNYLASLTATDNCTAFGSMTLTQSPVAGSTIGAGPTNVTLTVSDGNGNSATCNFTVTVTDQTNPTITSACPSNQTVSANASCQYSIPNYTAALTATDNCTAAGSIIKTQVPAAGTLVGTGVTNVTLTVTDANGNSATCNFTVTVQDNTNPTITSPCPSSQTVSANASCQYSIPNYTASITATDNCTASGSLIITQNPVAGTLVGVGVTAVTVTVTDGVGNASTCNFNVTVQDNTIPTITSVCPSSQTVAGNASCQYVLPNYLATLTATDNCTASGSLTYTQNPVAGTAITGSSPVVLTVTDGAGNSATCNFTITVQDNTNPIITSVCPSNQTVNANATCGYVLPNYLATLTATDNCTASGSLTITQSPAAGSTIGLGATPVTLTVADAAGNSATCNFTITVSDVTAPTITGCPANQTLNIVAACSVALPNYASSITVSDNCSAAGAIIITQAPVAGTVVNGHGTVVPVTLTVTDAVGNVSTCSFNVTTADDVNPTITCPGNQTAAADANCDFTMIDYTGLVTTSDNCAGIVSVTQNPAAGTVVSGTQNVIMTATDAAGNTSTCSFQVVVADNTDPIITSACPTNQTVNADATCGYTLPNFAASITATDNCTTSGALTITQLPVAGSVIGTGVTTVTVTVADANGNSTECIFDITVEDNTNPIITNCPANQNLIITSGCDALLPDFTSTLLFSDNCTPGVALLVNQSPAANTVLTNGTVQTVTLTVEDLDGNIATCTFDVTVVDGVDPVFDVCVANQNETPNANCEFVLPDYTSSATVSDNCSAPGSIVITQSPAAGATITGTSTITLTATDQAGNTSTCTFDVILTDGTPPTITSGCPADISVNADANCEYTLTDYTSSITVTDNCSLAASLVVTQSPVSGTLLPAGANTITLTATDANGNSSNCSFTITVEDNTAPVISNCPINQNLIITSTTSCDAQLPDFTSSITVTDNCTSSGSIVITQSPIAGTVLTNGTVQTVTLTAEDTDGNISTCTFDITVVDGVNPTFVACSPDVNEIPNANCEFVMIDYTGNATVDDNCTAPGSIIITQSPAAGSIINGTSTITLTATDLAGNTATCTFQVIIADGTPPTITSGCPADQSVSADASCGYTMTDFTSSITVTDNCNLSSSIVITQSPAVGSTLSLGANTITLTATDMNGNASNCTFVLTVEDNTGPVINNCPANQDLTITSNCEASLPDFTSTLNVTDNCSASGSIIITQSPVAGTLISGNGTITTVTLSAEDSDGNITTCSFDVTNVDGVSPTFTACTPDQNETPDVNCEFTLSDYTGLATVTDNCVTSTVTITQSPTAGSVILGTTTITLTATDQDGNFSTCTFDVILTDGTPPVITSGCPSNQNVNADASCGFTITDFTSSLTVTDNCNSASVVVTQSPVAGSVLPLGVNTITLTATDANGNSSNCTFDITVIDVTPPTITCPANIISCTDVVTFIAPVGTDNCSGSTTVQTDVTGLSSGSVFPLGTTTLTYTVTDGVGNNVSCSFDVTVVDVSVSPNAGADLSLCATDVIPALTGTASSGGNLTWYDDSSLTNVVGTGSSFVPFNITGTTTYYLSEDISGCNSSPDDVSVTINVCDTLEVEIPTGFTPDGDGVNDVWEIPNLNTMYPNCNVQIYGRWGGLLFESQGYATPWDGTYNGKQMPIGSYYFVIDFGNESEPVKGTVTIID